MSDSTREYDNAAQEAFADSDVSALLRMDFGDAKAEGPEPDSAPDSSAPLPSGQEPSPTTDPAVEGQPPLSAGVAGPPAAPAADERTQGFMQALQWMQAQQAAQQQPQQPNMPPPPPAYAYDINEQMLRAVTSDDMREREMALKAFAVNLSQTVHQRAVEQLREEVARAMPAFVRQVATQEYERKSIAQDFYGKYPEFDRPEVLPVVAQVAQQVMQETGASAWSAKVRDAVAGRTRALLGALANNGQQRPAPQMTAPSASPMNNPPGSRNILRELGIE